MSATASESPAPALNGPLVSGCSRLRTARAVNPFLLRSGWTILTMNRRVMGHTSCCIMSCESPTCCYRPHLLTAPECDRPPPRKSRWDIGPAEPAPVAPKLSRGMLYLRTENARHSRKRLDALAARRLAQNLTLETSLDLSSVHTQAGYEGFSAK